jgi:hypothetical protein
MTQRILVMGLPGAGKTFFAQALKAYLEQNSNIKTMPARRLANMDHVPVTYKSKVDWFNADDIRRRFNDWDFTHEGRIRQSIRMFEFAIKCTGDYVICDFVAPLAEMRLNFKADWTIWIDTIAEGRFADTNKIFQAPDKYDFRITEQNAEVWAEYVGKHILENKRRPVFNWQQETAQLLGRYQPWHEGHRALFEQALERVGQVVIEVRDCQGWNDSNPFDFEQVSRNIRRDLDPLYQGRYEIIRVPNIVEIAYGRDVGYKITKIELTDELHAISATKIRESMGLK